ncbi:MAG: hypothetical protein OXH94_11675 [Rhodospirillales bacterium]|nr:hypothetical protein [Rhodospirillales bacterium]
MLIYDPTDCFDLLDDFSLASTEDQLGNPFGKFKLASIGALAELEIMRRNGLADPPALKSIADTDISAAFSSSETVIHSRPDTSLAPRNAEVLVITRAAEDLSNPHWAAFRRRAQFSAEKLGVSKKRATQLVGSILELEENIHLHSGSPGYAIVCYALTTKSFEFVVADSGIGVRESLRSSSEYYDLEDDNSAIAAAITDGVSRFGSDTGRGRGFHELFEGLFNTQATLRFRSGQGCILIDGQNPSVEHAEAFSRSELPGFTVAVACKI